MDHLESTDTDWDCFIQPELADELATYSLFIVFDGHSGNQIADKAAEVFMDFLLDQEPFETLEDGDEYDIEEMKEGIRQSFLVFDKNMQNNVSEYKLKTSGW